MSEIVSNRSEILFLYDVKDINPNGDPLDENKPRIDEETMQNLVTDVRLKRTVRDYLHDFLDQEIFIRGEAGTVLLVWSFMHADETILCPFPERKHAAFRLAALCKVRVGPEEEIYELAKSFQQKGRLSAKDAIHLACASYIGADVFLTCDDALIRRAKRLELEMKIMNPVDYIRQGAIHGEVKDNG